MANKSTVQDPTERQRPLPLDASIIDNLFDMASSYTVDAMLNKALKMSMQILGAEAGSLLFQAQPPRNIQAGAFKEGSLNRILRWEDAIIKRLQGKGWQLPPDVPIPIAVDQPSNGQLVLVNAPLIQKKKVVGSISFVLPSGSTLTEQQKGLLGRIAAGIGQVATMIMELELAHQRLNRISVFYDVGQALVTTFDITKLLSETMALATNLIDAGAASIMLVDEEKQELVFKVSHGSKTQILRQQRIPLKEGIAGWVARTGRPVIANDARTDHRFSHRVDVRTGFLTQSIAAVPLKVKGRIIGILEVLNKYSGTGFTQDDVQLMGFIATQAAIAIENARLYNQVKQERDEILRTQEEFFQELTGKLHDGSLQFLSAISLSVDHLNLLSQQSSPEELQNQIGTLKNLVEQANRNMRNLLFELRPAILETEGLIAACKHYVGQLSELSGFTIHFKSVETININDRMSRAIFAIIQEALNNIKQHAQANNVWFSLVVKNNRFVVRIEDDGKGFDVNRVDAPHKEHLPLGILNMRERAAMIQAVLQIESAIDGPNQGTIVQLILPYPDEP